MPRDALTTRTGLVLGAASLLLAVTAFGLTTRTARPTAQVTEYGCVLMAETTEPLEIQARVPIAEPDPLVGLSQECRLYITGIRQLAQSSCAALPPDARKSLLQAADQLLQTWQSIPDERIDAVTGACREGHRAIQQALTHVCPQTRSTSQHRDDDRDEHGQNEQTAQQ